jgi:hypothetical protein
LRATTAILFGYRYQAGQAYDVDFTREKSRSGRFDRLTVDFPETAGGWTGERAGKPGITSDRNRNVVNFLLAGR